MTSRDIVTLDILPKQNILSLYSENIKTNEQKRPVNSIEWEKKSFLGLLREFCFYITSCVFLW